MTASPGAGLPRCAHATRPAASAGFTLLEVLVAMALLAVIASALYGTYFTLFRGKESAVAGMDERRAIRDTLDRLRCELSSAWVRSGTATVVPKTAFVVEDRDQFGKPASRLAFVTTAGPNRGSQSVSDQIAVEYGTAPKGDALLLNRTAQDLHVTSKPIVAPQVEEIEGFLVECSPDGTKWVKSWDTAINSGLPKAVRVTLQVREGSRTVGYSTLATLQRGGR